MNPSISTICFILFFFIRNVICLEKICGEFISNSTKHGKFSFDSSMLDGNDSMLCLYKFIANKNEKVMLRFDKFDVKSLAPECANEYIDTYIEVNDDTIDSYVESNFLSRWCGWKKPEILVSFDNIIIFAYHTDGIDRETSFHGSFNFISSQPYDYARIENSCVYEFNSKTIQSGTFMSPTYPGTYPNILNCTYKFIGQPNERIYLSFEDISLHFGADHCPYDSLRLHDYQRNQQEKIQQQILSKSIKISKLEKLKLDRILIDTYCGRKSNISIYSTNNMFEIEFEMSDSLSNDEYSEDDSRIQMRKGFKAFFKFSKHFADLSFITGTHIVGSNCDQLITSKEQTGLIYSPNYFRPTPADATCKYVFEGLNDEYNLESVKINFIELNLKPATAKNVCNENSVSHFVVYGSDKEKSKPKYCFVRLQKPEIRSVDSQMTLVFNTINADQSSPANFKANYTFFTEFGIEGTRLYQNRTCFFLYNGDSVAHGSVNSPRFPNNYPLNMRCTYLFNIGSKNERILFTFREFRLSNTNTNCTLNEDSLSIYQTNDENDASNPNDLKLRKRNKPDWRLINRHCGSSKVPGPFITDENQKQVKYIFISDNTNNAQGFVFNYNYVRLPECLFEYKTNANLSSGEIVISNDLKSQYYCDWYITTDPDKIILLTIKNQNLEDVRMNQFVIRIYDLNEEISYLKDNQDQMREKQMLQPVHEYYLDKSTKYYEISSFRIKIQLVTGKSMVLDDGRLILNWVEATKNKPCLKDEFMCAGVNYCIKTSNYCDKIEHCPDNSDEPDKCFIKAKRGVFPINQIVFMIGSIVLLIVFLTLCIYCRIKTLKRTHKKNMPPPNMQPPLFYKYSPANSIDYLEAAITSV